MNIPENKKISPFLVFFLVHANQVGVGVLGFQRPISEDAGYDAWISIIIVSLFIHLAMWIILKMVFTVNGDFLSIHEFIFGKWIAKILGTVLIVYLCLTAVIVLRNYIEIIQVWMFPRMQTFWFALVFLILVIYIVGGGLRVITGIAFFSVILPTYILFIFFFVFPYSDFTNLLPVLDHSLADLFKGTRAMSFTMTGFEALLFFYPFIKEPNKAKKWAHLGIALTIATHIYLAIITFAYFPEAQIQKNIWPTLTMWKIVEMPFVERFEYIGIANWCIVVLPNICIPLWAASRMAKQIFSIRQKTAVPILALIILVSISMLSTRTSINLLTDITGQAGFYLNFIYIPLLFLATLVARKVKKNGQPS